MKDCKVCKRYRKLLEDATTGKDERLFRDRGLIKFNLLRHQNGQYHLRETTKFEEYYQKKLLKESIK